ncbi:hypothetical protein [Actinomadura sp. 9N407]|uniref:hypothetical protein n=1 Tax=Actinomadura sp. 9N407 TaxID=3375154 RepID=UPI0037B4A671
MSSTVFQVVDVTKWEVAAFETAGLEEKLWLIEPATGRRWLYKPVTHHANPHSKLDPRQGEDWAEKISAELARLLSVPAAEVEMASRDGVPGSISLNLKPQHWEMQPGTVLVGALDPEYDLTRKGGHVGHTLQNVQRVLRGYAAPPGWPGLPSEFDAFDTFAGFLVLDAWIANRDRHSENWAVLRGPGPSDAPCLSPSYDHASSLGYHLARSKLEQILASGEVGNFATRKATAHRYQDGKDASLVDFAHRALARASPKAHQHWMAQLSKIEKEAWASLVAGTPGMSDVAGMFVVELLEINRRRLLDA